MKIKVISFVIALACAFTILFSSGAQAGLVDNATVLQVFYAYDRVYVAVNYGNNVTKTYWTTTTEDDKDRFLATALTALSNGSTIKIWTDSSNFIVGIGIYAAS